MVQTKKMMKCKPFFSRTSLRLNEGYLSSDAGAALTLKSVARTVTATTATKSIKEIIANFVNWFADRDFLCWQKKESEIFDLDLFYGNC